MAEQDDLDKVFRDGAAIDGDEGPAAAVALALDGAGDHLLADARFAFDQDRDVRLGTATRRAARHWPWPAQEAIRSSKVSAPPTFLLRRFTSSVRALTFSRFCIETLQALGADRLDHEIVGAGPHRLDDGFDRALRRLDDDRNMAAHAVEPRQQFEAVHARHDEIEHDQIDRPGARLGEKIERRRGAVGEQRVMAATADHAVQETPLGRIVVNDENAMGHGNSLACQSCRSIDHAIEQDPWRPLARPIAVKWWSRHWQRSVKRLLITRRIETTRSKG